MVQALATTIQDCAAFRLDPAGLEHQSSSAPPKTTHASLPTRVLVPQVGYLLRSQHENDPLRIQGTQGATVQLDKVHRQVQPVG